MSARKRQSDIDKASRSAKRPRSLKNKNGSASEGNSDVDVIDENPVQYGDNNEQPAKMIEEMLKKYSLDPGQLLIAGLIDWEIPDPKLLKKHSKVPQTLLTFNKFTTEKYLYIASSASAMHNILINMNHKAMSFGRNKFGQLGHSELKIFNRPTIIAALEHLNIVQAACGHNHSLFLTDAGMVFACGDNKSGQCGVGKKTTMIMKPIRINYVGPQIIKVGCGAEFSCILDVNGNLHTFGCPEYGQLGHNTDGKYFITATKLSYHFEMSPRRICLYLSKTKNVTTALEDVHIVDFSCGNNHIVAIDSMKRAYSWGFGAYGQLGHNETTNILIPRMINYFFNIPKCGVCRIFCGSTYSLAITETGALFLFGQNYKNANMYPKQVTDLAGWGITSIGCAFKSIILSANDSLIAWGGAPTYGELGLGTEQKSSTIPKEVENLKGMKIPLVAMGKFHSMILVNTDHKATKDIYKMLPEYTPAD